MHVQQTAIGHKLHLHCMIITDRHDLIKIWMQQRLTLDMQVNIIGIFLHLRKQGGKKVR